MEWKAKASQDINTNRFLISMRRVREIAHGHAAPLVVLGRCPYGCIQAKPFQYSTTPCNTVVAIKLLKKCDDSLKRCSKKKRHSPKMASALFCLNVLFVNTPAAFWTFLQTLNKEGYIFFTDRVTSAYPRPATSTHPQPAGAARPGTIHLCQPPPRSPHPFRLTGSKRVEQVRGICIYWLIKMYDYASVLKRVPP